MKKFVIKTVVFLVLTIFIFIMSLNFSIFRGGLLLTPILYFVIAFFLPDTHRGFKELLKKEQAFKLQDDLYIESLEEAMGQEIKPELYGEEVLLK